MPNHLGHSRRAASRIRNCPSPYPRNYESSMLLFVRRGIYAHHRTRPPKRHGLHLEKSLRIVRDRLITIQAPASVIKAMSCLFSLQSIPMYTSIRTSCSDDWRPLGRRRLPCPCYGARGADRFRQCALPSLGDSPQVALTAQGNHGPCSQARADGVADRRLGHLCLFYLIGTFLSIIR